MTLVPAPAGYGKSTLVPEWAAGVLHPEAWLSLDEGDDEPSRTARLAYLKSVRPLLCNPEEVYFAGKMERAKLSFLDRFIAGIVKAVDANNRDWQAIRGWVPAVLQ